ncbi:hypothetical protein ACFSKN_02135 [Mariniflexile gromovii]|uniref:Uncharacterized protein n=1 Tax=Mariniflexile gromovii TaxID=362523 RepID=A0ABS4BPC1_9FLAO|nr:hypothetical protein [Mariniflexile gromovii]MBP0902401.1 hypothetical protein [Mariniflexile gromovii]
MEFTLDSVTQYKESLRDIYLGKTITEKAVFVKDLNELTENILNRHFFGILTIGSNVDSCLLKEDDDTDFISVDANSQIIECFSSIECLDAALAIVSSPKGHFRGFEINIR